MAIIDPTITKNRLEIANLNSKKHCVIYDAISLSLLFFLFRTANQDIYVIGEYPVTTSTSNNTFER
jgi:hypothetical protein